MREQFLLKTESNSRIKTKPNHALRSISSFNRECGLLILVLTRLVLARAERKRARRLDLLPSIHWSCLSGSPSYKSPAWISNAAAGNSQLMWVKEGLEGVRKKRGKYLGQPENKWVRREMMYRDFLRFGLGGQSTPVVGKKCHHVQLAVTQLYSGPGVPERDRPPILPTYVPPTSAGGVTSFGFDDYPEVSASASAGSAWGPNDQITRE
ncbi:hypothetical protein C8F04DRAFT_1339672 [Mycena alexandri]|uniref:Uncharacterized protein n=1 Tax=Mycena alexandri TaxID=1745969 RepID=A0AAD6SZX9_9AGAR|nr:hypothetical protein C8F04DRAFT_1339672 [Mycena alexandri]